MVPTNGKKKFCACICTASQSGLLHFIKGNISVFPKYFCYFSYNLDLKGNLTGARRNWFWLEAAKQSCLGGGRITFCNANGEKNSNPEQSKKITKAQA